MIQTENTCLGYNVISQQKEGGQMKWKLFCNSGSTELCQSVKASFVSLTSNMALQFTQEGRRGQALGKKENA